MAMHEEGKWELSSTEVLVCFPLQYWRCSGIRPVGGRGWCLLHLSPARAPPGTSAETISIS